MVEAMGLQTKSSNNIIQPTPGKAFSFSSRSFAGAADDERWTLEIEEICMEAT